MITVEDLLEVELKTSEDFLKVKETLTRIGIASKKTKSLFQSCHILHKQGKYYIIHFKELFALDGKQSSIDEMDIQRRNTIAKLLSDWGLVEITKPVGELCPVSAIKIIPHKEKSNWNLVSKYTIGKV